MGVSSPVLSRPGPRWHPRPAPSASFSGTEFRWNQVPGVCRPANTVFEFFTKISFCYVDVVLFCLVAFGVYQGKKRGILGECIDLVCWGMIVLTAGLGHRPLAALVSSSIPGLSTLVSSLFAYFFIAGLLLLIAGALKRRFADKLLNSDSFGGLEFYLGMGAGAVRMLCVAVTAMALINAREYTPMEIQAREKSQEENFGSIRFFRLYSLQADIFNKSASGRAIKANVPWILIGDSSGDGSARGAKARPRTRRVELDP